MCNLHSAERYSYSVYFPEVSTISPTTLESNGTNSPSVAQRSRLTGDLSLFLVGAGFQIAEKRVGERHADILSLDLFLELLSL